MGPRGQKTDEPVGQAGVYAAHRRKAGEPPADLAHQNAGEQIQQDVLAQGKRGDAYKDRHDRRRTAPDGRYGFIPSDPRPAEPGDQTVDGGEKTVGRVEGVQPSDTVFPNGRPAHLWPYERRGNEDENQKTHGLAQEIRAEKRSALSRGRRAARR